MYTTFMGHKNDQPYSKPASGESRGHKAKRQQVSRACEPCRTNRAKCSKSRPCHTCLDRGLECTDTPPGSKAFLSTAKELNELRSKVQDLERHLHERDLPSEPNFIANCNRSSPTRQASTARSSTQQKDPQEITAAKSPEILAAGAGSIAFSPTNISHPLGFRVPPYLQDSLFDHSSRDDEGAPFEDLLSKSAQLYYLGHFWLDLHYILPVLCERDTDVHFEGLWPSSAGISSMAQKFRRPSPLIDIILACAVQYDARSRAHPGIEQGNSEIQNVYFARSQNMVLGDALNSPELVHVQILILLSHYLENEGKMKKASVYSAIAIRIAIALELHRDPPDHLTTTARELRRRIWWTLYTAEAKVALVSGRPWTLDMPDLNVRMMADDVETAVMSCSKFAKDDGSGSTWLSYSVQMTSLYRLAMKGLMSHRTGTDERDEDPVISSLEHWARQVPVNLRTLGTFGDGDVVNPSFDETPFAFSPEKYRLKINFYKPQWLQKQCLLLELHFRHVAMLFCKHAIDTRLDRNTAGEEPHPTALKCVHHALSISRILLQAFTETALLDSHLEALHMLWNSSSTLISFSMAFESWSQGNNIVQTLRMNCDVFGHFAGVTGAARTAQSQLQQYLQQGGYATRQRPSISWAKDMSQPAKTSQDSSPVQQVIPSATGIPISMDETLQIGHHEHRQSATNADSMAYLASHFGSIQGMSLSEPMPGLQMPSHPTIVDDIAWSAAPSATIHSNPESYSSWTSDGVDSFDMDNFMFDLSSISSVEPSSGNISDMNWRIDEASSLGKGPVTAIELEIQ